MLATPPSKIPRTTRYRATVAQRGAYRENFCRVDINSRSFRKKCSNRVARTGRVIACSLESNASAKLAHIAIRVPNSLSAQAAQHKKNKQGNQGVKDDICQVKTEGNWPCYLIEQ